ncbi:THxN family PEP-CTERM protein [Microcoleus sp. herbarium2]|uniref:THxN family PEP-CTERM protein n=1 Tax=Microcoleus sp. herbarium2 TaxID=3055433 RepID=UPI002FCF33BC
MNLTKFSLFKLSTASAALVFGIAPQAEAISLNLSSGSWNQPVGGSEIVYQTVASETQVRWGISPDGGGTSQKSGLGFTGVGPSTFGLGEIFQVGQVRHFNNLIFTGTAASAVNLSLSLNFDNPTGTPFFNLNLQIEETVNEGSCGYFSITPCADKISISETSLSNKFSVAGIDYTLQLLGFSLTPGEVPINEFITQEGETNQALLFAKVTAAEPEPVPEPATLVGTALWLLAARWAVGNKRKKGL